MKLEIIAVLVVALNCIVETRKLYPGLITRQKQKYNDDCPLEGHWIAHWASLDIICEPDSESSETGTLSGEFHNTDPPKTYDIKGRYTYVESAGGKDVTFGFVAAWNDGKENWKLSSSWSGLWKADNECVITTFWISATDTDAPDLWDGFGLGKHVFNSNSLICSL